MKAHGTFIRLVRLVLALLVAVSALAPGISSAQTTSFSERDALRAAMPTKPAALGTASVISGLGQFPLYFIENRGQTDPEVVYYVKGSNAAVFFTPRGLTIALQDASFPTLSVGADHRIASRYVLRLEFVGAREVTPIGEQKAETLFSYFRGSPQEWVTGVPSYHRLTYRQLWPGIDLSFYGQGGKLKYEFLVHPGADPRLIRLAYSGTDSLALRDNGDLALSVAGQEFLDAAPVAYQLLGSRQIPVHVSYEVKESEFAFAVNGYNPALPLVIDPELIYCGYIGGTSLDDAVGVAVGPDGSVYIAGTTSSDENSFPVAVGPDVTYDFGAGDVYVARLQPDFRGFIYCGYISGTDWVAGIAVDGEGAAYVAGTAGPGQLPVSMGPDLTLNGVMDAFVVKVAPDGTALEYGGYIGGEGIEYGQGVAVGPDGSAYLVGKTTSKEDTFPVTVGPDLTYNGTGPWGDGDAFVARISPDGSRFIYCGYIGGIRDDEATGVAVDASGAAYVVGTTRSSEATFPVRVGPDLVYDDVEVEFDWPDVFIAKVAPDGASLVYCGYIGGTRSDEARAVAVDRWGNAYVTGNTYSTPETGFPVLIGPVTEPGYSDNGFITKVSADGQRLIYSGFVGGLDRSWVNAVAVDDEGVAYIVGGTPCTEEWGFPVKGGPDLTHNGYVDAFVAKVRANGSGYIYCGYIGGSESDTARGIAIDIAGNAYVVGQTDSIHDRFPVRGGPDLTHNGSDDGYVAKVGPSREYLTFIPIILR